MNTRDPRPPIPPCEMASPPMGLNMGVFGFLPTTHTTANVKGCKISVLHEFVFMLRLQWMQVICAPDKPRLFSLREKPKDPQFEPHAGIKMVQILGSLVYICGTNLVKTCLKNCLCSRCTGRENPLKLSHAWSQSHWPHTGIDAMYTAPTLRKEEKEHKIPMNENTIWDFLFCHLWWYHSGWTSNNLISTVSVVSTTLNIGYASIMTPSKMGKGKKRGNCGIQPTLSSLTQDWTNPNRNPNPNVHKQDLNSSLAAVC